MYAYEYMYTHQYNIRVPIFNMYIYQYEICIYDGVRIYI